MSRGDPQVDQQAMEWAKQGKKMFTPRVLSNLDQKVLRDIRRNIGHLQQELSYYLDIRNEQGRGGKK